MAKHISQLCGESQMAFCLSRGDGAILRILERSWTSNKPQKQATAKAARVTFSTNNWLNIMCTAIFWWWKVCLAVVCMKASFPQIWSHMHNVNLALAVGCTYLFKNYAGNILKTALDGQLLQMPNRKGNYLFNTITLLCSLHILVMYVILSKILLLDRCYTIVRQTWGCTLPVDCITQTAPVWCAVNKI